MALKEKALRRLADKLNASGVAWCAWGAWAQSIQGVPRDWHGFELMVDEGDAEKADRILTRLGMRHEEADGEAARRVSYHFDGADVTMTAGCAIRCGEAVYHPLLRAAAPVSVLGASVPVLRLESELPLALLRGDEALAALIAARLKAAGSAPDPDATAEPLPEQLLEQMNRLMEEKQ